MVGFILILLLCSESALAQDESMLAGISGEPVEMHADKHELSINYIIHAMSH